MDVFKNKNKSLYNLIIEASLSELLDLCYITDVCTPTFWKLMLNEQFPELKDFLNKIKFTDEIKEWFLFMFPPLEEMEENYPLKFEERVYISLYSLYSNEKIKIYL